MIDALVLQRDWGRLSRCWTAYAPAPAAGAEPPMVGLQSVRLSMERATGSAREVRSSARRDDVLAVAEKQVCRDAPDPSGLEQ
jgi:hypothetical protein